MLYYAVLCGCKISEVRSTVDGVKRRDAGDGQNGSQALRGLLKMAVSCREINAQVGREDDPIRISRC
jgi:hypothetical protein